MRKLLLAFAISLAFISISEAQTVTKTLSYDFLNATLAEVNSYVHSLKIDAAVAAQVTPTCTLSGTTVNCQTPITLASGTHVLVLTVVNTSGNSASGSLNYDSGSNPITPGNIKVIIKITVP